ncbi:hypothetical protein D3C73_1215130 [compost metagenome]
MAKSIDLVAEIANDLGLFAFVAQLDQFVSAQADQSPFDPFPGTVARESNVHFVQHLDIRQDPAKHLFQLQPLIKQRSHRRKLSYRLLDGIDFGVAESWQQLNDESARHDDGGIRIHQYA